MNEYFVKGFNSNRGAELYAGWNLLPMDNQEDWILTKLKNTTEDEKKMLFETEIIFSLPF